MEAVYVNGIALFQLNRRFDSDGVNNYKKEERDCVTRDIVCAK